MGYFEARKDHLSFFADIDYMKIGLNASMVHSRGTDLVGITIGAAAGLKYEIVIAELAAAYEVAQWGASGKPGTGTAIDVFAGARGWWQKADASVSVTGTVNLGDLTLNGDGTLSAAGTASWIDPLVGFDSATNLHRG